ncbi:MAG: hypothetical protein ABI618_18595 [Nitrospirota bacterium]
MAHSWDKDRSTSIAKQSRVASSLTVNHRKDSPLVVTLQILADDFDLVLLGILPDDLQLLIDLLTCRKVV